MLTRRKFITGTSAMLAMSMTPIWVRAGEFLIDIPEGLQLFPGVPLPYTKFIADYLVKHSGYAKFNILYDEWHMVEADLVEVKDGPVRANQEEFSMVLHSSWEPLLEEKTYIFEHAWFGRFPMYLRPVDSQAGSYVYEVTVSRLLTNQ